MWRQILSPKTLTLASAAGKAAAPLRSISAAARTPPLFSATRCFSSDSGNTSTPKTVEDVVPIATGPERDEIEAELQAKFLRSSSLSQSLAATNFLKSSPTPTITNWSKLSVRRTIIARSLSNMYEGGSRPPAFHFTRLATGSLYQYGKRFLSNEPDTHDDFKPTNKLESSDLSLNDVVEKDVKNNPVMIYMKGVPDFPQCGFSSLAVRVLKLYEVHIGYRNILEDPELKSAVKAFSHWPTFPQIFINGEFIGGSDIVLNLHQNGELKKKLEDISANQGKWE